MNDLCESLRRFANKIRNTDSPWGADLLDEARKRIESLEHEVEKRKRLFEAQQCEIEHWKKLCEAQRTVLTLSATLAHSKGDK